MPSLLARSPALTASSMKQLKRNTHSGRESTELSSTQMQTNKRIFTSQDLAPSHALSRSQPIPIQSKMDQPKSDDPYDQVDTQAQYDMATWNMYVLITNARRLRALNQGISGSFIEAPNHTSIEAHEGCILQPSTSQVERLRGQGCVTPFSPVHQPSFDVCQDGIFELDPM